MISTKTVENALTTLRDRHQSLGDELRQKAIEQAGVGIAIEVIQGLLDGPAEATAEVVPRQPRRLTHRKDADVPQADRRRGSTLERHKPIAAKETGRPAANGDRDAAMMKMLDSGKSAREVAEHFGVSQPTVYNARARMKKRGAKPATAARDDEGDDPAPGTKEPQQPSGAPLAFLDDNQLSPTERAIAVQRVEGLLKQARAMTADQIMRTCRLGPKQFRQVADVANIELNDDSKYQLKRRF